jgi:hypothetical protein
MLIKQFNKHLFLQQMMLISEQLCELMMMGIEQQLLVLVGLVRMMGYSRK